MSTNTTPIGADAQKAKPPGIYALQCVIASLRDTAHFSDEEGELTNDLRTLRDWALARAALSALSAAQDAPAECEVQKADDEAKGRVEALDLDNHRLRRAMQKVMARLTSLLDEDQFGNIESIVTEAGVEPPQYYY